MTPLYMLRIEVDGHFHGGPPPKPWVARIHGPSEQYGLAREFIRAMNDWKDAHRAWSGNLWVREPPPEATTDPDRYPFFVRPWTRGGVRSAQEFEESDEVRRLKQITGLAELFADREFSHAWEPVE
ncbi:MAG TPA: hypothetical protein VFT22_31150 [Kofleriaceae bacterium]|nr:hypothetical protein [Kofleriaceae bacterium]